MTKSAKDRDERVVKITETCGEEVVRTYYCVKDTIFGHWMTGEPFSGKLWSRKPGKRIEFDNEQEALAALMELYEWREDPHRAGHETAHGEVDDA